MDHAASGGISREFVLCRDGDQAIKLDNIDQKYSKLAITSQHETNLRLILFPQLATFIDLCS